MAMKHIDEPIYWAPTRKLGGGWIAHKDTPQAPQAPDPNVVSKAQTQSNIDTATATANLNRVNTTTPWGSLTYGKPTFDQGAYQQAMDAYHQSMQGKNVFDAQRYLQDNPDVAKAGVDPLQHYLQYGQKEGRNAYGFDPSKPADSAGPAPNQNDYMTRNASVTLAPEQQKLLDLQNEMSTGLGNLGVSQLGNVSKTLGQPLSLSGAPGQVSSVQGGPLQTGASYGSIQNDLNRNGMAGIQNDLDTSQVPGLIGGDKLATDLDTTRDALYKSQTAYMDPQWQQRQHDMENQLTQQGVMQNSDAWNRAMDDLGRQRTFDYNQARQSAITGGGAEQSRLFGLGLAANQNAFGQALSKGQFHNSAQAQDFGQRAQEMELHNAAQSQGFGQAFQNASMSNAAQAQQFGQGVTNAGLQNDARKQSINEILMQREQPLNELNALRTGSQVTAPQFPNIPGTSVAPTDVVGPYNTAYQGQMGAYNSQIAQNNAMTSGLFNLGASYFLGGKK